jgi:iron complex transport system substrate-binding protein
MLEQPAWRWARHVPVWAVDANSYLSRPGPRVVDGIELLARILNPDLMGQPDPAAARSVR